MNIAVEYLLRGSRVQKLLTLPCALFLENTVTKNNKVRKRSSSLSGKMVVTLSESPQDSVRVRQYNLEETSTDDVLPFYTENVILKSEVFSHPDVIMPRYRLMEFIEEPYITPERHYTEFPQAPLQEKAYQECREKFFNPKRLKKYKTDWLWKAFEKIYGSEESRKQYRDRSHKCDLERERVRSSVKTIHGKWKIWEETFLNLPGPATELVFARAFKSPFLKVKTEATLENSIPVDFL
jgi:hypothetical protein